MKFLQISFKYRNSDAITFPANPANTFRGALGFQLLRIACVQRKTSNQGCRNCDLFSRCAYAKCYETSSHHIRGSSSEGSEDMPHLMVIDSGFPGLQTLAPGNEFCFRVILFGHGIETVPYIIVAARNAGLMGLTRQRVPCELISVVEDGSQAKIWSEENDHLQIPEATQLKVAEPDLSQVATSRINLKFITPVAFKDKRTGHPTLEPDFARIVGSLMRRYSSFEASEGNDLNWNYARIAELARKVRLTSINAAPVYWERFSSRQNQRIPISGIIGQATYEGPVRPFFDLLQAGQIIRCGRSTTFGQGRICFEETEVGKTDTFLFAS
ncbi:MAG: CRISPR system precrRNA processing endoribonuclease RAMP protein Cas6 [Candidatus Rifleibacteriota bacterium]